MKQRPPIGIIRPLVTVARRLRGLRAPLAPMVWRRRPRRAGPISILRVVQPAAVPAATNVAVNLQLAWPICAPAAPAPGTIIERVLRQTFRAGREGARVESNRLFRLVETIWRTGPAGAQALPSPTVAPRPPRATAELEWPAPVRRSRSPFADPGDGAPPRPMANRAAAMRMVLASRPEAGAADPPDPARPLPPRRRLPAVERVAASPAAAAARAGFRRRPMPAFGLAAPDPIAQAPAQAARPAPLLWKQAKGAGPLATALLEAGSVAAAPASWKPRTALIWRDPPADETRPGPRRATDGAVPAAWRDSAAFTAGGAMAAAPAAPPAAVQPPDMGRLVDEVVRRLERIGRDERLRRGL
jgi:hypothetical protein